jgi:hypothetical protein
MISQSHSNSPQPPQFAVWLLTLFTPAAPAESILGDLHEEFSGLAIKSGLAVARTWYWRQTLKTIMQIGWVAFRTAPWTMLATVIAGFWAIGFETRSSGNAMHLYLDTHRVYVSHPDAYLFWYKFPLEIGRVIICISIGALVALVARRREMAAVVGLAVVQMALLLAATITVIASGREWFQWFQTMLLWNGLCAIATVVGGAIVTRLRVPAPTLAA